MIPSWPSLAAAGLAGGLVASCAASHPAPLLVNESASLPRGIYVRTGAPVAPGRLVTLAPPPAARAYLAGLGVAPNARLLKRVAAVGGAQVCSVDGRLTWPRGEAVALRRDRRGRALPAWQGCRRLAADALLVMGDTPTSFDSRYFGPVRLADVEGVYREGWRW
jgi:type IV secretory pathway protease TraF